MSMEQFENFLESTKILIGIILIYLNEESNPPSYAGENGISRSVHDINKKPPMLK